ncbi:MAG TPA: crossover junction endodeoxyribonuclease RuvC [Desulfohalobiaceae bacterium]|nr:crossover junction endodeoxyribonuclease RuvC [Desulfohalobiaceae bacterium]
MNQDNVQLVLGLDPGSRATGYGIISESSGKLALIDTGTIRPNPKSDLGERLGFIFKRLSEIIVQQDPLVAAVEDIFVAHNTSSALKLGQARGAALVACSASSLPIYTYEATLVKKTLVGVGRADKSQVAFMVGRLLGVKPYWTADSSDALAVAICHLNHARWAKWNKSGIGC